MTSGEIEAQAIFDQAQKKTSNKATGFFGSFFGSGGSSSDESAVELYVKAGNMFKISKSWEKAGNSFNEAATINLNTLKNALDATQNFIEAGNCYRKENYKMAIDSYKHAIDIYVDMGRFNMAAKHLVTIAEIYDQSLKDMHNAVIYYEKAADFYKGEESRTQANKCLLKIAEYAATNEDYQKSIKIFEEVAESCLDSNLLKYSLKEYYFKATICNLCLDVLAAKRCIDKYCDLSPHFMDSRECILMRNIITAVEEENACAFTEHLQKYDSISRFDNWCSTLLLRVKKEIEGEVDLT